MMSLQWQLPLFNTVTNALLITIILSSTHCVSGQFNLRCLQSRDRVDTDACVAQYVEDLEKYGRGECCVVARFTKCLQKQVKEDCDGSLSLFDVERLVDDFLSRAVTIENACDGYEFSSPTCWYFFYPRLVEFVGIVLAIITISIFYYCCCSSGKNGKGKSTQRPRQSYAARQEMALNPTSASSTTSSRPPPLNPHLNSILPSAARLYPEITPSAPPLMHDPYLSAPPSYQEVTGTKY